MAVLNIDGRRAGHVKRDDECAAWLACTLADGQRVSSAEILTAGRALGFSRSRILEVKRRLGIAARKSWGRERRWTWELRVPKQTP